MYMFLRARVIEGTDQWYDRLELDDGKFEVSLVENDKIAIHAPCTQEGFNSLYDLGKRLWDQDLCSKFEIAAFASRTLFWKHRPDQWNFEENRYASGFETMLSEEFSSYCSDDFQNDSLEMDYLKDYQNRFWRGRTYLVNAEYFEDMVKETLLQENLKAVRGWVERTEDVPDNVGFEFQGMRIVNPFYDETLRFEVDPVSYYGLENVKKFVEQVKLHLSVPVVEDKEPLDTQIFGANSIKKSLPSNNVDRRESREREN